MYLMAAVAALALFGGCKAQQSAFATYSAMNGDWSVTELNGQTMNPEETRQSLSLDMSSLVISGYAGCNRMSGKIELSHSHKDQIRFGRVVSTRMACMDMKPEDDLLEALDQVVRFELLTAEEKTTTGIAFYDATNQKRIVFEKKQ